MSLQEDFGGLLSRARKMCGSCPFRLRLTKVERQLFAAMPPDEFPCHTEDGYMPGSSGIQCRGHWEVRRTAIKARMAESQVSQFDRGRA